MKLEPQVVLDFRKKNGGLITDLTKLVESYPRVPLTVDCVVFGFDEGELKVLVINSDTEMFNGQWTLLGDFMQDNETLEQTAYRSFRRRTGINTIYLELVGVFSDPNRHPGGRVITVAYCSLVNIHHHQLQKLDNELHWHSVKNLRDMAFDHLEILTTCHRWLQKRILEHPLAFNLLPENFSLSALQHLYEAILDIELDKRNFRKKFFSMGYLVDTGKYEYNVPHRPSRLYRFNYTKYEQQNRKWNGIDF